MKAHQVIGALLCMTSGVVPQALGQPAAAESRPKIVKAELHWHELGAWPPESGVKKISVKSPKQLDMLSAAFASIQQWDDRFFGIPDRAQDIYGELHVSTENSRFRVWLTRYGYYFDPEIPQFRHHFYSVGLTDAVETILRESGIYGHAWDVAKKLFDDVQFPALTGKERLQEEEREWSATRKRKRGQND